MIQTVILEYAYDNRHDRPSRRDVIAKKYRQELKRQQLVFKEFFGPLIKLRKRVEGKDGFCDMLLERHGEDNAYLFEVELC